MNYEMKIAASTLAELGERLLAAGVQITGVQALPAQEGRTDAKPAPQGKSEPKAEPAEEPKVKGVEEKQSDTPNRNEANVDEYDYAIHVAPRVLALVDKKGREAAKEVLASFDVKKASDVPAEKYGALIAALDKASNA
jgi:hypothetical protein